MKQRIVLYGVVLAGILLCISIGHTCPPLPCPPCVSNWPNCNVFCGGQPNQLCCDDIQCYNIYERQCCYYGNGKTCDHNIACCAQDCCSEEAPNCCDNITCYNSNENEYCCSDGNGHICGQFEECCGESNCCEFEQCKFCVNGECLVCSGLPDRICCPGIYFPTCVDECTDEVVDTETCDEAQEDEYDCPGCTSLLPPLCHDHVWRDYTDLEIEACSGGCPMYGDQDIRSEICYEKKYCGGTYREDEKCIECQNEMLCLPKIDSDPPTCYYGSLGECIAEAVCTITFTCYDCCRDDRVLDTIYENTCKCK